MDTIDASASEQFIENVAYALNGESLDYLVVQHMEPDHGANIQRILELYPEAKVVGNAKSMQMIGQFFDVDLEDGGYGLLGRFGEDNVFCGCIRNIRGSER